MSAEWHYTKDGQQHGPMSAAELKALAQAGKLAPTDMVWKAGMAEWKVASSVKGLFPASAPDAPPPASTASLEPVASAPNEDSFSFMDKAKERLGRAIGPRGADKLTAAKSFFKKNRLWIGVGAGVVACVVLILFLLPAGTLPGGKKGYTQSILDLDPAKQKEYGVVVPKGAKPLYAPRSVEDFLQSLTLFKRADGAGSDISCVDMKSAFGRDIHRLNEANGVSRSYQADLLLGVYVKQKCWDQVYGPQEGVKQVAESSGFDRRFGGGQTLQMNQWSVACTNETVLVRGYSTKDPGYSRATKDEVHVWFVHFNTPFESICPGKGDSGQRRFSFNKFYKDK
ncbi:MAG: DUF4339 domain-containing protein [Gemmataceae bacterium]|nr:DUF4339 domain-containing protein [Gemmataceae bacterium]